MNKIGFCIGDWSGDGHEKTETFYIESKFTEKDFREASSKGKKIVRLGSNVCSDYEDRTFPGNVLKTIIDHGLITEKSLDCVVEAKDMDPDWKLGDDVEVWGEEFFKLHLAVCKIGNPDLEWKVISDDPVINIGGYGLFY